MKIIFCDMQKDVVDAFKRKLDDFYMSGNTYGDAAPTDLDIEVVHGDILEQPIDVVVAPGNSFGIMEGGLDGVLRNYFGFQLQREVQTDISFIDTHELAVGRTLLIKTKDAKIGDVLYAPTMRLPGTQISHTTPVVLATRSAVHRYFMILERRSDEYTLGISGMGTGVGRMPPELCASAMMTGISDAFELYKNKNPREMPTNSQQLVEYILRHTFVNN